MTFFQLNYLLKALAPNIVTLVGLVSRFEFWEDSFQYIVVTYLEVVSFFADVISWDESILD